MCIVHLLFLTSITYERFGSSLPHYAWVAKVCGASCYPIATTSLRVRAGGDYWFNQFFKSSYFLIKSSNWRLSDSAAFFSFSFVSTLA